MSQTLFSLAGFEVTIIGRFWVTAEENENPSELRIIDSKNAHFAEFCPNT